MKITCPYCFEEFGANEALFRCRNDRRCPAAGPDHVYSEHRDISPPEIMGHVFSSTTTRFEKILGMIRVQTSADCDECGRESLKRVCPNCHQELSHDAGRLPEKTIAIIGARASGKSNYIATLIHELRHRVLPNFDNASIQHIGDSTANRYRNDFQAYVYGNPPRQVPATASAVARDASVRIPMIYRVTVGSGRGAKAVNLVIFDTAGEDMNTLETMSNETKYITTADGIIFLLDPTQIPQVRQQVPDRVGPAIADADPIVIIERLYSLYERMRMIRLNGTIDKPVAFTLSKIDVLEDILPAGHGLHRNSQHFNALDTDDIEAVHSELETLMARWGLIGNIDRMFSKYRFFGVSAFGGSPNPDGTLDHVVPKRVEDPILWILSQMNIIKKG